MLCKAMRTSTYIIESLEAQQITTMQETLNSASRWLIVMDENTKHALGDALIALITHQNTIAFTTHCFPSNVLPTLANAERLANIYHAQQCQTIIAIGSGTLNDLSKYAAYLCNTRYIMCATAPSMNGYVSGNASLIMADGHKTTLKAQPPIAVFCPMDVITAAPLRLIQAGFGDAICRSTAQVDWLFSHLLLGTPYDDTPFQLTYTNEPQLLANAAQIYARDTSVMRILIENLLASGEGMRVAGGSYPASQGEHMLAHTMEMLHHHNPSLAPLTPSFHGEEIAVTTLYMACRQAEILSRNTAPVLLPTSYEHTAMERAFGTTLAQNLQKDYQRKSERIGDIAQRQHHINTHWHEIRDQLSAVHVAPEVITQALQAIHAPLTPTSLGWKDEVWHTATSLARFTRDRFTMLDVA